MRAICGSIILILTIGMLGCSSVPKRAGFATVQAQIGKRTGQKPVWKQGGPQDKAVDEAVNAALKKPLTLPSVIQIALWNDPELQILYENLGVAEADVVQASLPENPTLSGKVRFPDRRRPHGSRNSRSAEFGPSVSISHSLTGAPAFSLSRDFGADLIASHSNNGVELGNNLELGLVQDFVSLLMVPVHKRLAQEAFDRERLDVTYQVLAEVSRVERAYYEAVAAEQMLELDKTVTEATDAASKFAVRQYEAGNLSRLEMSRHNAFNAEALLAESKAETNATLSREQLDRLLGLFGNQTAWKLADSRLAVPKDDFVSDNIEAFALEHRQDIAAAVKNLELLAFKAKFTRQWRWLGLLNLNVSTERDPDGVYVTGPELEVQLPIFDRGQAKLIRSQAALRAGSENVRMLAITIRSEAREAWLKYATARDTVRYYQRVLLPVHQEIVNQSQLRYNAMISGVYDLLKDKQDQINTGKAYVAALRDYWLARADLESTLGGVLPPLVKGSQPASAANGAAKPAAGATGPAAAPQPGAPQPQKMDSSKMEHQK